MKTLKAIRAKIKPEPAREPLSPPPKRDARPRPVRQRGGAAALSDAAPDGQRASTVRPGEISLAD
jgi:hypothetical protein